MAAVRMEYLAMVLLYAAHVDMSGTTRVSDRSVIVRPITSTYNICCISCLNMTVTPFSLNKINYLTNVTPRLVVKRHFQLTLCLHRTYISSICALVLIPQTCQTCLQIKLFRPYHKYKEVSTNQRTNTIKKRRIITFL